MTNLQHSLRLASTDDDTTENTTESLPASRNARRGVFLKWLRKVHSWIGLWGAALGLLFGVTGILHNHRAVMKIPAAEAQESMLQVSLPNPAPANAQAMFEWLQGELAFDRQATRVRSETSKAVAWGDKSLKQPARWSGSFSTPRVNVQAEYWVGNNFVSVKRSENNVFGILNNLHKGVGVGIGWILLADTLGGSIILLSITGVVLWAGISRRRMVGTAIGLTSIAVALGFAIQSM
jgi:hypothetical protein